MLARWIGRKRQTDPQADDARWVVLDVESSGLDARLDRLLSIAAVAVQFGPAQLNPLQRPAIAPGDSFEALLRQVDDPAPPDRSNILLHGIGIGAQRAGVEPALAMQGLRQYVGRAPLLAFHAAFDRTLIERAMVLNGGTRMSNPWLDLAPLAAALLPHVKAHSLDDWLEHFGIACLQRHQAAADALASAELLLRLWPALRAQRPQAGLRAAAALIDQRRWLSR